mmetsp:Transcript_28502/g.91993  ORF Transcript_28502/g.91993 Transcript_28502/m.91993 type:complete len:430 (-) Transcript_28502:91-1380(-)
MTIHSKRGHFLSVVLIFLMKTFENCSGFAPGTLLPNTRPASPVQLKEGTRLAQLAGSRRSFVLRSSSGRGDATDAHVAWVRSQLEQQPEEVKVYHHHEVVAIAAACWNEASRRLERGEGVSVLSFPEAEGEILRKVAETMMLLTEGKLEGLSTRDRVDWKVQALKKGETWLLVIDCKSPRVSSDASLLELAASSLAVLRCQRWVERVIIGMRVCPFTQSVSVAATGLSKVGIAPGPIGYPVCHADHVVHVLSALWNTISDMLSKDPTELSTVLLLTPCFSQDDFPRYAAASRVISNALLSLKAEKNISLVFFHPFYEREAVFPVNDPTHGHLPPENMLRSMLLNFYEIEDVMNFEDNLHQNDFSRRSPMPMINLLRTEQVELAEQLTSGAKVYCANAKRMAQADRTALLRGLASDMAAPQLSQDKDRPF